MKKLLLLLAFIGLAVAAHFFLEKPIETSGRIFINETDNHLYDRSLKLSIGMAQERAGVQNAIVMLKEKPTNVSIEELATQYFQKYRIGESTGGKGILYLYVEKDNEFKIEVSYALEGQFPDAICSRLEAGARTFMLTGQKRDFLTELLVTMNLHLVKYQNSPGDIEFPFVQNSFALSKYLSGGGGVVGRSYSAAVSARKVEVANLNKEQRQKYLPGSSPEETLNKYLSSLEDGVGDELLPLLTDGSQFCRMENPKTPGYLKRQMQYYKAAFPFEIVGFGEFAVAVFKWNNPVLHVILRERQGKWFVDEARMWAEQHLFENGLDPVVKYSGSTIHRAWYASKHPSQNILYDKRGKYRDMLRYNGDLELQISETEKVLAKNPTAKNYFELGDLLYFESYWLAAAIPLIEKGLALSPDRDEYRWRLIDMYMNNSDIEPMLVQYKYLAKKFPNDDTLQSNYKFYLKSFEVTEGEVDKFAKVSQTAQAPPDHKPVARETNSGAFTVSKIPSFWPPQREKEFPKLEFVNENGELSTIQSLKGKWVLFEPIGMNCPGCQALAGAHKKGPLGGIVPQQGLPSIDEIIAKAQMNLGDSRIHLVQLLLYDLSMGVPTAKDARIWREHFDVGKDDGHWVIAGTKEMQNQASYDMIPGFYLIDPEGKVVSDSTGHNPKDNLYTHLVPKLNEGLQNTALRSHAKPRDPAARSLSDIEKEIGLSPEDAYRSIPHQRTLFSGGNSPLDPQVKKEIEDLLKVADTGVALRVQLAKQFRSGSLDTAKLRIYDELIMTALFSNSPQLEKFRSTLVEVFKDHKTYFSEWASKSHSGDLSHPKVKSSSEKLHAAYAMLMALSPKDSASNKQAFFDYLCALDFL